MQINKSFTYYTIIKDAISSYNGKATASMIFSYAMAVYPRIFRISNSLTWKSCIRQVLTKHKAFIKIEKGRHFWAVIEECNNGIANNGSITNNGSIIKGITKRSIANNSIANNSITNKSIMNNGITNKSISVNNTDSIKESALANITNIKRHK